MTRIRLSKTKELAIDSMINTTFWSSSGIPISSAEFVQQLFGDIPSLFNSEEELRLLWSDANTRKGLLVKLADLGYSFEQLAELRRLVHGTDSDLYDVLKLIAFQKSMIPRSQRAAFAKTRFDPIYSPAQIEFLAFILDQYVKTSVSELDADKLTDLLVLKYKSIPDAKKTLGSVDLIRDTFLGFQRGLYA